MSNDFIRVKNGRVVLPGMYLQDVNGIYRVDSIDDLRNLVRVYDVEITDDDDLEDVGSWYYKTAYDIKGCDIW